jgi:hypothetical protein
MKALLSTVTASLTLALSATAASALILYDGLSSPYQTPSQQNWLYQATAIGTIPKATATSSGTVLDTGDSTNYAGYFNQNPIILDRSNGYTVSFRLRVNSESHGTNNNRAGFSVLVISNLMALSLDFGLVKFGRKALPLLGLKLLPTTPNR